jgi:hypothetical protein
MAFFSRQRPSINVFIHACSSSCTSSLCIYPFLLQHRISSYSPRRRLHQPKQEKHMPSCRARARKEKDAIYQRTQMGFITGKKRSPIYKQNLTKRRQGANQLIQSSRQNYVPLYTKSVSPCATTNKKEANGIFRTLSARTYIINIREEDEEEEKAAATAFAAKRG